LVQHGWTLQQTSSPRHAWRQLLLLLVVLLLLLLVLLLALLMALQPYCYC
jgi:hypothetical protein